MPLFRILTSAPVTYGQPWFQKRACCEAQLPRIEADTAEEASVTAYNLYGEGYGVDPEPVPPTKPFPKYS